MYQIDEEMPDVNGSGGLIRRTLRPNPQGTLYTLTTSYPFGMWAPFEHPRKLKHSEAMQLVEKDGFKEVK